jgi:hypothetical protein
MAMPPKDPFDHISLLPRLGMSRDTVRVGSLVKCAVGAHHQTVDHPNHLEETRRFEAICVYFTVGGWTLAWRRVRAFIIHTGARSGQSLYATKNLYHRFLVRTLVQVKLI